MRGKELRWCQDCHYHLKSSRYGISLSLLFRIIIIWREQFLLLGCRENALLSDSFEAIRFSDPGQGKIAICGMYSHLVRCFSWRLLVSNQTQHNQCPIIL